MLAVIANEIPLYRRPTQLSFYDDMRSSSKFFSVLCTVLPNNKEGMTELFSVESTDIFLTLVHKYSTMCGISVRFLKYDKICVNEVKRPLL